MPVAVKGTGGGSVTLTAGAAATDTTLTLPNTTGTVALTASPTFSGTVTATTVTSPASTALTIQSAGTTAMTVDTSQNVGIGITSPAGKLDILTGTNRGYFDDSAGSLFRLNAVNAINSAYSSLSLNGSVLTFQINGTESARIDSSGNLLVGTITNIPSNARLSVVNQGAAQWGIGVQCSNTGNGMLVTNVSGTSVYTAHAFYNNGTTFSLCGTISVSGSSTAYNTSSDYRLKHDVQPMDAGLATINALNPVNYKWNSDNSGGEGFIAHELQAVIPLAVTGEKDAVDEDGNIKPQGVDYSKIVVHLVAAIQELSAKNDALEAANAAFEARLAALEAK
jgi:hypothetical protein